MKKAMTDPKYINLDLDLESFEDLTRLADYLDNNACLLSHEVVDEISHITVEASLGGECITPEVSADKMLSVIESMPKDLYGLFISSKSRVFDFGFEGGYETNPLHHDISPELIRRISKHRIAFRLTIYSYREDESVDT